MNVFIITVASIALISTTAAAEQFKLKKSNDSYISLNECLYALSKGARLKTGSREVFIYKNQVWSISFGSETGLTCDLVGLVTE